METFDYYYIIPLASSNGVEIRITYSKYERFHMPMNIELSFRLCVLCLWKVQDIAFQQLVRAVQLKRNQDVR